MHNSIKFFLYLSINSLLSHQVGYINQETYAPEAPFMTYEDIPGDLNANFLIAATDVEDVDVQDVFALYQFG